MNSVRDFCDTVMFLKEGKVGLIDSPQKSVDAYLDYLETQK